jgi:hypothetical protein
MDVTIKQIRDALPALQQLMSAKLPAKAAYAVSKLATTCQKEANHYNAMRTKCFEDAGCKIEGDEWIHPDDPRENDKPMKEKPKRDEVVKHTEEMLDTTVSINVLPLDLEQFKDAEIPGGAFFSLDWAMKTIE